LQHDSKTIDPGLVGLAISYALGITSKLSELVSTFAETERELVAVERCCQYIRWQLRFTNKFCSGNRDKNFVDFFSSNTLANN
jgi:hypothetical protein